MTDDGDPSSPDRTPRGQNLLSYNSEHDQRQVSPRSRRAPLDGPSTDHTLTGANLIEADPQTHSLIMHMLEEDRRELASSLGQPMNSTIGSDTYRQRAIMHQTETDNLIPTIRSRRASFAGPSNGTNSDNAADNDGFSHARQASSTRYPSANSMADVPLRTPAYNVDGSVGSRRTSITLPVENDTTTPVEVSELQLLPRRTPSVDSTTPAYNVDGAVRPRRASITLPVTPNTTAPVGISALQILPRRASALGLLQSDTATAIDMAGLRTGLRNAPTEIQRAIFRSMIEAVESRIQQIQPRNTLGAWIQYQIGSEAMDFMVHFHPEIAVRFMMTALSRRHALLGTQEFRQAYMEEFLLRQPFFFPPRVIHRAIGGLDVADPIDNLRLWNEFVPCLRYNTRVMTLGLQIGTYGEFMLGADPPYFLWTEMSFAARHLFYFAREFPHHTVVIRVPIDIHGTTYFADITIGNEEVSRAALARLMTEAYRFVDDLAATGTIDQAAMLVRRNWLRNAEDIVEEMIAIMAMIVAGQFEEDSYSNPFGTLF